MTKYKIYFELFGKKMSTEIFALNEERAKDILRSKIIFHKIEDLDAKKKSDDFIDGLKKMARDQFDSNPFGF